MTAASFQASATDVQAARTTYMVADASYEILFQTIKDIFWKKINVILNVMNLKYKL